MENTEQETNGNVEQDMRKLTVDAIRGGLAGLDQFQEMFVQCSDFFEQGKDAEGMEVFQAILEHLSDFVHFCSKIKENTKELLSEETLKKLEEQQRLFEEMLEALLEESENGNLLGISDVLRLDLVEVLENYKKIFPELADELEAVGDKA